MCFAINTTLLAQNDSVWLELVKVEQREKVQTDSLKKSKTKLPITESTRLLVAKSGKIVGCENSDIVHVMDTLYLIQLC